MARKIFSFVLGVSIQTMLCGTGFLLNIPLSVVSYLSMSFLPRNVQHIVTIIITFAAMTILHLYYEGLDIIVMNLSSVSMISFCKQMGLALCYKDGDEANFNNCTSREKAKAVRQKPTLVNYLSYMFFVGQVISGPFSEYCDFEDWLHLRNKYKKINYFDTWLPALKRFG
jgi:D-alanyl-lipoteichoic acid acyltransferase DltB (MBOAT superfamily)